MPNIKTLRMEDMSEAYNSMESNIDYITMLP